MRNKMLLTVLILTLFCGHAKLHETLTNHKRNKSELPKKSNISKSTTETKFINVVGTTTDTIPKENSTITHAPTTDETTEVITITEEVTTPEEITTTEEVTTPKPACELLNITHALNDETNVLAINWTINDMFLCENENLSILLTDKNCLEKCIESINICSAQCTIEQPSINALSSTFVFSQPLIPCSTYYYQIQLNSTTTNSSEFEAYRMHQKIISLAIQDNEDTENIGQLHMNITWNYDYTECKEIFRVIAHAQSSNYDMSTSNYSIEFRNIQACEEYNITIYPEKTVNYEFSTLHTSKRINPSAITDFNVTQGNDKNLIELKWDAPSYGAKCIKSYIIFIENEYENDTMIIPYNNLNTLISDVYACVNYNITLSTCTSVLCIGDDGNSYNNKTTPSSTYPPVSTTDVTFETTKLAEIVKIEENIESSVTRSIKTEPRPFNQPQQPQLLSKTDISLTLNVIPSTDLKKNRCEISEYNIVCLDINTEENMTGFSRNSTVIVSGLQPYHNYSCSAGIQNEKGEISVLSSPATFRTNQGVPEKPNVTINFATISSTSFTIEWEKPNNTNGPIKEYRIHVKFNKFKYDNPDYCRNATDKEIRLTFEHSLEYNFTEGWPNVIYHVQVQAINQEMDGHMSTVNSVTTNPDKSDVVMNFVIDENIIYLNGPYNKNITVYFDYPCQANGPIQSFNVDFVSNSSNITYTIKYEEKIYNFQLQVSTLEPDINYSVSVYANQTDKNLTGKALSQSFKLKPGIPEANDNLALLSSESSTTSVYITIPGAIFNSNVGRITHIKILVVQMECHQTLTRSKGFLTDESEHQLAQWGEAMKEECIPLYDTKITLYNKNGEDQNEGIGTDPQCSNACNGPLRPGTIYGLTFRLYTETGFSDTKYFRVVTDKEVPLIAILITIISILCIVFSIGFYISCRKKIPEDTDTPYDRRDILVNKFYSYYGVMTNNSSERMKEEYKAIQYFSDNLDKTFIASKANEKLNRYQNIHPYDSNRVVLNDDEFENDYINASYINGYYYPKEYIAAQGPKPNTSHDFWRMVLQHKCESIVMLTSLVENNKVKCHEYFPKLHGLINVGNIKIVCVEEQIFSNFIKRILKVEKDDVKLKINHYYFNTWPDHGCPNNAKDLIEFVKIVRNERQRPGETFIVHCSAGVGRTGTFIALDVMMQRIKKEGKINIFDLVKQLRIQRIKMVQTLDQYSFLYKAALELVTVPRTNNVLQNIRDTVIKYINEFELPKNWRIRQNQANKRATIMRTDAKETVM